MEGGPDRPIGGRAAASSQADVDPRARAPAQARRSHRHGIG
ncbi:hypothetical protein AZ78_5172 [Lysobacter capsici AZ78]|uniref:Uncharacterized protein n=1 Tax=Lysobacter capsici AZ78 TaxID=1444315 RepID=A0A125TZF5_9GAMM|nr:hypothetical protein AZ78_5172 [Lysobacter capsici AZ78]